MLHFLKSPSGTAWTEVIPAKLLIEFFVTVHDSVAALHVGLRWEALASFAAGFVEKIDRSFESLLPDGFARHITKGEITYQDSI
jgi:hypothetical protein